MKNVLMKEVTQSLPEIGGCESRKTEMGGSIANSACGANYPYQTLKGDAPSSKTCCSLETTQRKTQP